MYTYACVYTYIYIYIYIYVYTYPGTWDFERSAEHCRSSDVRNLDFDETNETSGDVYMFMYTYIYIYIYTYCEAAMFEISNSTKLYPLFLFMHIRRRGNMVGVNMVGVNVAFHDAICGCSEGAMREPCLPKPCFHVAGVCR